MSGGHPPPCGDCLWGTGTPPRWAGCSAPVPSNGRCPGSGFGVGEGSITQRSDKVDRAGPRALPSLLLGCPCRPGPVPSPGLVTDIPPIPPPLRLRGLQVELLSSFQLLSQHLSREPGWRGVVSALGSSLQNVTGMAICHPNRAGSGGWEGPLTFLQLLA